MKITMTIDVPHAPAMAKVVDAVSYAAAGRLEQDLEAIWPVATGRSQRAWDRQGRGADWLVVNDAPYAAYVTRRGMSVPIVLAEVPALLERTADRIAEGLAKHLPASILHEVSNG